MSQSAELSTLMTTPLAGARGHARSTAEAKNQRRLSATAQAGTGQQLAAVMMVVTFALAPPSWSRRPRRPMRPVSRSKRRLGSAYRSPPGAPNTPLPVQDRR